jgi:hypothetical protein
MKPLTKPELVAQLEKNRDGARALTQLRRQGRVSNRTFHVLLEVLQLHAAHVARAFEVAGD